MDCSQIGLQFAWQCACAKNGAALGYCKETEAASCTLVGTCCDKYFFPPPGCKTDGEACAATADCCYSVCTSFGQCGCLEYGTACQADADCCGNVCNHLGQCGCFIDGAACETNAECCGQNCDTATGTCITYCQPKDAGCQVPQDCCSNSCYGFFCE